MAVAAKRLSDIGGAGSRVTDDERDHGAFGVQVTNLLRSRGETDRLCCDWTPRNDLS